MVLMMPILVLSATRPHLEGKFKLKDIKKGCKMYRGRRLDEKNINQMIRLASVPVRISKKEITGILKNI